MHAASVEGQGGQGFDAFTGQDQSVKQWSKNISPSER
jgi:hypothetical protein